MAFKFRIPRWLTNNVSSAAQGASDSSRPPGRDKVEITTKNSKRFENPAFEAFLRRDWGRISAAEWREAFREFQEFSYASDKQQSKDGQTIVMMGLGILYEEFSDEALELADWALANPRYTGNRIQRTILHYRQSRALFAKGQIAEGLANFLAASKEQADKKNRSTVWRFGTLIQTDLRPQTGRRQNSGVRRNP